MIELDVSLWGGGDWFDGNVYLGMFSDLCLWMGFTCGRWMSVLFSVFDGALIRGCTKPFLFCTENVDLTRMHLEG